MSDKKIKYYGAPMEGVNSVFYRNAQEELFGGIEKHISPFLVPNGDGIRFKRKQLMDILPENNRVEQVTPQLLTNKAEDFVRASKEFADLGYKEVNLNLGCPSGTVVSKKKGSGFLAYPEELDQFLYEIFEKCPLEITVKTRLGIVDPEEFYPILEIYNRYQMRELILHPRVQKDMYKYPPHMAGVQKIIEESKNPICYNGDIFTPQDAKLIAETYPQINSIMLGRGLITNPALVREIEGGKRLELEEIIALHNRLYSEYKEYLFGDTNLLYRMKEYWYYLIMNFEDHKKLYKKLRKATKLETYQEVVHDIFTTLPLTGYFDPYK